jgi:hypothetical protein
VLTPGYGTPDEATHCKACGLRMKKLGSNVLTGFTHLHENQKLEPGRKRYIIGRSRKERQSETYEM